MNQIATAFIRFYQITLSPFLGGQCRFAPTCSQYALDCFAHYSFFQALGKSIWRILRCQPFSVGYFDPAVPDACNHSHMEQIDGE